MTLRERLSQCHGQLSKVQVRVGSLKEARRLATERAEGAEADTRAADVALAALHSVRDETVARVQQTVAELCSEGLRIVFDDPDVRLEVRILERRGVVEADLVLVRGELETDPLLGNGGGLIADAAAMLRMIMVKLLSQRGLAPLLVLDEPFAALSAGHREAMAHTLEELAEQMGVQVIMVTHADEFARGDVYRLQWADREAILAEVVE